MAGEIGMSAARISLIAFAFAMISALFLFPQPARAQGMLEACQEEIEELCSNVSPGNGRLIACMYAHENYLSEGCANATADLGDILDFVFTTVGSAMAICGSDIEKHCAGTEFGGGRILTCLHGKSADLTPDCRAIVDEFSDELASQ
jgi:Cysteine rich repeat